MLDEIWIHLGDIYTHLADLCHVRRGIGQYGQILTKYES